MVVVTAQGSCVDVKGSEELGWEGLHSRWESLKAVEVAAAPFKGQRI